MSSLSSASLLQRPQGSRPASTTARTRSMGRGSRAARRAYAKLDPTPKNPERPGETAVGYLSAGGSSRNLLLTTKKDPDGKSAREGLHNHRFFFRGARHLCASNKEPTRCFMPSSGTRPSSEPGSCTRYR